MLLSLGFEFFGEFCDALLEEKDGFFFVFEDFAVFFFDFLVDFFDAHAEVVVLLTVPFEFGSD